MYAIRALTAFYERNLTINGAESGSLKTCQKGQVYFCQVLSGKMPQCQQLTELLRHRGVEQASASDVQSEQVGMKGKA